MFYVKFNIMNTYCKIQESILIARGPTHQILEGTLKYVVDGRRGVGSKEVSWVKNVRDFKCFQNAWDPLVRYRTKRCKMQIGRPS